jgi:hypothetical protein
MPLAVRGSGSGGTMSHEYEGCVDESSAIRPREARPAAEVEPDILALLDRVLGAVTAAEEGLTAVELRDSLKERPDRLQRALLAGLRGRKIRRSGSRCQTRYLVNR